MQLPSSMYLIHHNDDFCQSFAALASTVGINPVQLPPSGTYLETFEGRRAGCVVIDLAQSKFDGIRVLDELSRIPRRPPVIALVDQVDVNAVVEAARRGVTTVIQKQHVTSNELLDAIQSAIDKDLEQQAKHARGVEIQNRFSSLKPGEWQVLEQLLLGHELTSIAENLQLSRRTIENRRARLFKKLEVSTFTALVALLMEIGHFRDDSAH